MAQRPISIIIIGSILTLMSVVSALHVTEAATTKVVVPYDGSSNTNSVPVCLRIYEYFPYCLGFLVGSPNYNEPSNMCCHYVNKLNILAKHRMGPRTICWCIQVMVKGVTPSLIPSRIQALPHLCRTTLSFPISDSMDCSKVIGHYD